MQIKKVSLSDLFAQLIAGFRLVGNNPGRFALASLLFILACSLLMLLIGGIAFISLGQERILTFFKSFLEQNTKAMFYLYAFFFIYYLALVPVYGGWLKLCQNLDMGTSTSSSEIFSIYHTASLLKKLLLYFIVSLLLYLAVTSLLQLLLLTFGIDTNSLTAKSGSNPTALLNQGVGFWVAIFGMACIGFLTQGMLYLGFFEATLSENGIVESLKAGINGVLKSLLSIIVFTIIMIVALALCMLMAMLAGFALNLIHEGLANTIWYLFIWILILFAIPISFAWQYFFWKGILGNDSESQATALNSSEFSA